MRILLARGDGSPSDPTQRFLLDCSDDELPRAERWLLAEIVSKHWVAEHSPSPGPTINVGRESAASLGAADAPNLGGATVQTATASPRPAASLLGPALGVPQFPVSALSSPTAATHPLIGGATGATGGGLPAALSSHNSATPPQIGSSRETAGGDTLATAGGGVNISPLATGVSAASILAGRSVNPPSGSEVSVGTPRQRCLFGDGGDDAGDDGGVSGGGTTAQPPRKQARVAGGVGGRASSLSSASSLSALVSRGTLGQARTSAPVTALGVPREPPTPWQVN